MRRSLLIFAAVVAIVCFQFWIFPGHTYLQGASQAYVPMLERLQSPGFLTRDLLAINPTLTFTAYDEATLFLQKVLKTDLRHALLGQLFFFGACFSGGVFLLLRALDVGVSLALLGTLLLHFSGPGTFLVATEPTPDVFAFSLVILAAGLFATEKPLLAGLTGGLALLYDPVLSGSFWMLLVVAVASDRRMRRMARPTLLIGAIFALLLANLAQLQPGAADSGSLLDRMQPMFVRISQFRTPEIWSSQWRISEWLLLLFCCGVATLVFSLRKSRPVTWVCAGVPLCSFIATGLSLVLLDGFHFVAVQQMRWTRMGQYILLFGLINGVAVAANLWKRKPQRPVAALLLVTVCLLAFGFRSVKMPQGPERVDELVTWAKGETWGGSMFLFPDSGRATQPGLFRAEAQRAVWVDWETGIKVNAHDAFADEWNRRWRDTMQGGYSIQRLQRMLDLPVDYIVLHERNRLQNPKPVFEAGGFVAYDTHDLRTYFKRSD